MFLGLEIAGGILSSLVRIFITQFVVQTLYVYKMENNENKFGSLEKHFLRKSFF